MNESIMQRQWYTGTGEEVDDISERLSKELRSNDQTVRIGTDAQRIGRGVDFVTVVVVRQERKGGKMFYCRTRAPRPQMSLWEKLSTETWYSLEVAMEVEQIVPGGASQVEVHADANPDARWKSHAHHQAIAGMIVSQGFGCVLKPDAWVSSHAADHIVKMKNESRKARRAYKRRMKKSGRSRQIA
jgi:predicted RNase H-related nuclease YkuK (DUF458 family)